MDTCRIRLPNARKPFTVSACRLRLRLQFVADHGRGIFEIAMRLPISEQIYRTGQAFRSRIVFKGVEFVEKFKAAAVEIDAYPLGHASIDGIRHRSSDPAREVNAPPMNLERSIPVEV